MPDQPLTTRMRQLGAARELRRPAVDRADQERDVKLQTKRTAITVAQTAAA